MSSIDGRTEIANPAARRMPALRERGTLALACLLSIVALACSKTQKTASAPAPTPAPAVARFIEPPATEQHATLTIRMLPYAQSGSYEYRSRIWSVAIDGLIAPSMTPDVEKVSERVLRVSVGRREFAFAKNDRNSLYTPGTDQAVAFGAFGQFQVRSIKPGTTRSYATLGDVSLVEVDLQAGVRYSLELDGGLLRQPGASLVYLKNGTSVVTTGMGPWERLPELERLFGTQRAPFWWGYAAWIDAPRLEGTWENGSVSLGKEAAYGTPTRMIFVGDSVIVEYPGPQGNPSSRGTWRQVRNRVHARWGAHSSEPPGTHHEAWAIIQANGQIEFEGVSSKAPPAHRWFLVRARQR